MKYKTTNECSISVGLGFLSRTKSSIPKSESISEIIEKRYYKRPHTDAFQQNSLILPLYEEVKESPVVTVRKVQDLNYAEAYSPTHNEIHWDVQGSISPIREIECNEENSKEHIEEMNKSLDKHKRALNMKKFYKENGKEISNELTGIGQVINLITYREYTK